MKHRIGGGGVMENKVEIIEIKTIERTEGNNVDD